MKIRPFTRIWLLAACAACGTRQPVAEAPAAEPMRIAGDMCPSPTVGENAQITSALGESSSAVIAFDGQGFTLAWWDMRGKFPAVSTMRVDRAGAPLTQFASLPHDGVAKEPTIAVDSAQAHVVWLDEIAVKSARLPTTAGAVKYADRASAAAAGPRGAVAWVEKGVLYFRSDGMLPPPDRNGERVAPPPTQVAAGGIEDPRVAWNGEQFAVVWSASVAGGRQIVMQRLSHAGKRIGGQVKVSDTAGVSRNPEVAAMPGGFAVAWTNDAPQESNKHDYFWIFFARVGEHGDAPAFARQLEFNTTADHVAIAAAGAELGLAWVGSKEPMGSAVFFARLDTDGKPLGAAVRVSDDKPITCGGPSLAFAGDGYGVAWHDDRSQTGSQILFSFLKCGEAGEAEASDAGAPPEPPPAAEPAEPKLKKLFE